MVQLPEVLPIEQDLEIYQGADFDFVFIWSDQNYELVNTTGYTADMQIRSAIDSNVIIKELTTGNGGIAMGGANGFIEAIIDNTDTTAMPFQDAVYDLYVTNTSGTRIKFAFGRSPIFQGVTR